MWKLPKESIPFAYLTENGELIYRDEDGATPIYTKNQVEVEVRLAVMDYLSRVCSIVERIVDRECRITGLRALIAIRDLQQEIYSDE